MGVKIPIDSPKKVSGGNDSIMVEKWLKTVARYLHAKGQPESTWGRVAFGFLDIVRYSVRLFPVQKVDFRLPFKGK